MKIGIIKETKTPVDNRVALAPEQVSKLNHQFPNHKIVVQKSDIRAFSDDEYIKSGVQVVEDVSDCDVLFGIKEAKIESLIPNKHYVFFGHIAKLQEYNRPLIQAMLQKNLTFTDYEYLVDDTNQRVCAFGWWAGVVGVYYTLRGYGLRTKKFELPKPDLKFTLDQLIVNLKSIQLPAIKILVTGAGRVSQGAQHVLNSIGATKINEMEFLSTESVNNLTYTVADVNLLVKRMDGNQFEFTDFIKNPRAYESDFMRWAYSTDVLICAHFWGSDAPVYLDQENLRDPKLRICVIGDVTCDILGGIKSTVRPATHANPYYDYNPITEKEEAAFTSERNITVMAVDTCPNALAMDTSRYFGEMLTEHVFLPLLKGEDSKVIRGATIIEEGNLTDKFSYLNDFAEGK